MKLFRRWAFNFVALISLLTSAALICALYQGQQAGSHYFGMSYDTEPLRYHRANLEWNNGYLSIYWDRILMVPGSTSPVAHYGWGKTWFIPLPPESQDSNLTYRSGHYPGFDYHTLILRIWPTVIIAALPAFVWLGMRVFRRQFHGDLCQNCGYDLRATPDRCPECGKIVEKVA